jgi:DNA-binding transcriptional LysR family regulator
MLNVTLRRFEAFLAIVERGSFVAAADQLGITQPSISAHISALEKQIGGSVFERVKGRKPVLTELGRGIVVHARELIAEADDLQADVAILRSNAGQKVLFSCQRSLANFVLRKPITDFAVSHPDVHLIVNIGKQEDVIGEVRDGRSDIGCFLSNSEIRGLRSRVIGSQRLQLVVAPSNPLAGRRKVSPQEVQKHGFVAPPASSLFGRAIAKLLAEAGITEMRTVAQATEYHFLRELVAAGLGISCSPETSIANDVAAGTLAVIDLDAPPLSIDIRIVTSPKNEISTATRNFADVLSQAVSNH